MDLLMPISFLLPRQHRRAFFLVVLKPVYESNDTGVCAIGNPVPTPISDTPSG